MPYVIYISTARKRLALMKDGTVIKRYPIGVGKMLTPTPTGTYTIINKAPNPGGPFGVMWMGLSRPHYGIHGTDNPASIGKNVSKGCVRMHNSHVMELSKIVPIGTKVVISA
ncbi:L,D-transpeptidase [Fictibacillus nanhaiensis]|uniref:L,D-transpeptidase n=1 Tax=Fictibacillus nanhaiensis TaxID=742169 RepID=UPI00203A63B2|nr:L,D-transpeptidase [Fictibacillus nanhaiensis]MCM3733993.1 L,D-transpeptidase [Fictibacillus nanhaiensis]